MFLSVLKLAFCKSSPQIHAAPISVYGVESFSLHLSCFPPFLGDGRFCHTPEPHTSGGVILGLPVSAYGPVWSVPVPTPLSLCGVFQGCPCSTCKFPGWGSSWSYSYWSTPQPQQHRILNLLSGEQGSNPKPHGSQTDPFLLRHDGGTPVCFSVVLFSKRS